LALADIAKFRPAEAIELLSFTTNLSDFPLMNNVFPLGNIPRMTQSDSHTSEADQQWLCNTTSREGPAMGTASFTINVALLVVALIQRLNTSSIRLIKV
jgi:hypothetical protein